MTATTVVVVSDARSDAYDELGKHWWIPLISGLAWFVLAWIFLSFTPTTVWTVAVFAGVFLIFGGVSELMIASQTPSWRWLHVLLGIVLLIGGVMAFVWPGATFLVMAALISWMIMFSGVVDVITSIMFRHVDDLWWLTLLAGILQIGIALWALGYTGRSIALLVVWLAVIAISRGIVNIVLALQVHKLRKINAKS